MRLPFPTRISVQKTMMFAAVVFVIQVIQGTDFVFSVLFFSFVMLSAVAFNIAGGFSRASGFYVFWFALLTCIVGALWKIVLGEPGSSNLVSPAATMATYVVSMLMIIVSLSVSHRLNRRVRSFSAMVQADRVDLGLASLGCLLANEMTFVANMFLPGGNGSLLAIVNQANLFLPFSILLGTVHTIRVSGGRRSVNVVTLTASLIIFVYFGLLFYSKQGMFTPIVCWGVAVASQRYRLHVWQIGLLVAFAVYSVLILSPLSQVGRALIPDFADLTMRAELTADLLTHPARLRAEYKASTESSLPGTTVAGFALGYYDTPQGLLDRLAIIQTDDRLITYTLEGHVDGYDRFLYYFINWIPHFILPDKEKYAPHGAVGPGNYYAHEVGGLLSPDDYSTGISFSPTAEAFHMASWLGLLILAPFVWILLFTTVDVVCGDPRLSPYGLIACVAFAHVAPESLIAGLVAFIWTGNIAIIMAILFCTYFAPILGTLLSNTSNPRTGAAGSSGLAPVTA